MYSNNFIVAVIFLGIKQGYFLSQPLISIQLLQSEHIEKTAF